MQHNLTGILPASPWVIVGAAIVLRVADLAWKRHRARRRNDKLGESYRREVALHSQALAWWAKMKVSACCHVIWVPSHLDGVTVPAHQPVAAELEQNSRSWRLARDLAGRSLAAAEEGRGQPLDWTALWSEEPVHGSA